MPDEILTGRAAELASVGFSEMPDPRKEGDADAFESPRDAADALNAERGETGPIVDRSYLADGEPAPETEAITLERAAHDLTALRHAESDEQLDEDAAQLRAQVDELRGVDEKPDAREAKAENEPEPKPVKPGELDPEIEKALNNPQIRAAIQQQIGETETSRQQYVAGLEAATKIAQATFMGQFPEFANVAEDQRAGVLAAIQQQNPARFAQIHAAVTNSARLFEQHGIEQQRQAQTKQAEFQSYAKAEDARFEAMIKNEPKATRAAVEKEIIATIKESGEDPKAFFERFGSNEFLRSAAAQKILYDAGKYRHLQNSTKVPAPTRVIPQVLRPGVSAPRAAPGENTNVRALSGKFGSNPNLQNAAALLTAKRAANPRGN